MLQPASPAAEGFRLAPQFEENMVLNYFYFVEILKQIKSPY
jgi:hypothetical protein